MSKEYSNAVFGLWAHLICTSGVVKLKFTDLVCAYGAWK